MSSYLFSKLFQLLNQLTKTHKTTIHFACLCGRMILPELFSARRLCVHLQLLRDPLGFFQPKQTCSDLCNDSIEFAVFLENKRVIYNTVTS